MLGSKNIKFKILKRLNPELKISKRPQNPELQDSEFKSQKFEILISGIFKRQNPQFKILESRNKLFWINHFKVPKARLNPTFWNVTIRNSSFGCPQNLNSKFWTAKILHFRKSNFKLKSFEINNLEYKDMKS